MNYPLKNNLKRPNAAFTLMELMIVIAIIGILSVIAVPNMITWRSNSQFNAAVRMVKSVIDDTRMKAIKSNMPARVNFTKGNQIFTTQVWDVANNSYAITPVTHQLSPGTTITWLAAGLNKQIEFNSRGLASISGSVDIQSNTGKTATITVNFVGTSQIQ